MNYLEVYFNGVLKHSLSMDSDLIMIGRGKDNDLVIDNMGVSGHHAVLSRKNDVLFIEDLNSTNGTFVNSQKVTGRQRISPQDTIVIGKHSIKLTEWSNVAPTATQRGQVEKADATLMMNRAKPGSSHEPVHSPHANCYLLLRGEKTGKKKLFLTLSQYGIGKAKHNAIRVGGWFTPAVIAEIEKIGHSFYISPLKKNKVKLNGSWINTSTLLSPADELEIKKLSMKFVIE